MSIQKQQPETVVELSNLTKRFRDVTAVDDIDLSIRSGEFLTLLGPSGCGKTTTLRMVAGFEKPSDGVIRIDGEGVTNTAPYDRDTGMVFQQYALFPHMTVADNVAFGLEMQGRPRDEIDERTRDALEMVRLSGLGDRYPSELSGGQQQRVALARALIIEPSVLLLDEPLSNLDKKLRQEMRLEILRLHRELDVTMIYVTHNQDEALTMSDRMAVMNDGNIHQVGTPEEVYRHPADEFVADFIGNANLLGGQVTNVSADSYTVDLDNGASAQLAASTADSATVSEGRDVVLLFRPERFRIGARGETSGDNHLDGDVVEATFLGSHMEYLVDVGDEIVHVFKQTLVDGERFEQGEAVTLSFGRDAPFVIPGGST
ncbi:Fe3+/spermidine/putrescine ABC transporter ATP-binding protein [Haloprofundus marisrubri]|uniref:Molybdate/tungstate import ATP-binding protein WtpC n=1 Tax=Haloprofundus marisrubri TaxID=1514971 RepID=A0A0W1RBZ5_9EURY|nr:ABC transporter ATP-binding protein [Haloprofundus marisrubri]KTG10147.1 Fe3+/spermidine/putrescine ABC transporter ATP-binding protein [Haloprofundus marisrubri]